MPLLKDFPNVKGYIWLWLHVNNEQTKAIPANFRIEFEKLIGLATLLEFYSIEALEEFLHTAEETTTNHIIGVVTEMGFFKSKQHKDWDKEAGIRAMELINNSNFNANVKFKYVISARVGKNEDNLKVRSEAEGFTHTYNLIESMAPKLLLLPLSQPPLEKDLHSCISTLRKSLYLPPVVISAPDNPNYYPVQHYQIDEILFVENAKLKSKFEETKEQFSTTNKPSDYTWGFHASISNESTYQITQENFSLNYLGTYSGNKGCYGMGIYQSTRDYMPMAIAIGQNHYMFLGCKVLKGETNKQAVITDWDKLKIGVPIPEGYDSNVSEDGIELVLRKAEQVLPTFLIKFSVFGLNTAEVKPWKRPLDGEKQFIAPSCNGVSLSFYK